MAEAVIVLDPAFVVGKTDPRLFGSFVEHLGRCVYGGIFEPGHPTARSRTAFGRSAGTGARTGVTVIRYPGGNFVSGYNWEDGVGPLDKRPRRRELAWFSTETNAFGTNEFMAWCAKAGYRANDGCESRHKRRGRSPGAAGILQRRKWHDVSATCDMNTGIRLPITSGFGAWAMRWMRRGRSVPRPPREYGTLATESAKLMRWLDPDIELVACGPPAAAWQRSPNGKG